jgi:nucleoid-associated protein YejK
MDILNVVVHKLNKQRREQGKPYIEPSVQLRENELNKDNVTVIDLINKITEAFKRGKTFGTFDPDKDNHPFQGWLEETISDDEDRDFLSLTEDVMNRLKLFIKDENFATGGHLLFALYKHENKRWLIVVMLKDKDGFTFTDDLNIENIQEIDIDKLHQLARIDIDRWLEASESEGYLSFIKKRAGDVSNYFIDALGCRDLIPSKVATSNIFSIVDELFTEAGLNINQTISMKDMLHDFMFERMPNTVNLAEIGAMVDAVLPLDFHGKFVEKANSDEYKVSEEFEPNAQALVFHRRIKHKTSKWTLDIERSAVGVPDSDAELIYDQEHNTLTLTHVPDSLAEEIKKSLKVEENEQ